jgi:hypothetical protein
MTGDEELVFVLSNGSNVTKIDGKVGTMTLS